MTEENLKLFTEFLMTREKYNSPKIYFAYLNYSEEKISRLPEGSQFYVVSKDENNVLHWDANFISALKDKTGLAKGPIYRELNSLLEQNLLAQNEKIIPATQIKNTSPKPNKKPSTTITNVNTNTNSKPDPKSKSQLIPYAQIKHTNTKDYGDYCQVLLDNKEVKDYYWNESSSSYEDDILF